MDGILTPLGIKIAGCERVKTPGKITSLYKLGDVAACHRAACAALRHAATSPNLYNIT